MHQRSSFHPSTILSIHSPTHMQYPSTDPPTLSSIHPSLHTPIHPYMHMHLLFAFVHWFILSTICFLSIYLHALFTGDKFTHLPTHIKDRVLKCPTRIHHSCVHNCQLPYMETQNCKQAMPHSTSILARLRIALICSISTRFGVKTLPASTAEVIHLVHACPTILTWIRTAVVYIYLKLPTWQCMKISQIQWHMMDITSHVVPANPSLHMHTNRFNWLRHVPPFWQGVLLHSSISCVQCRPVYPGAQVQVNPFTKSCVSLS